MELFIGPAGWNYPDWKGIVYPPKLPKFVTELAFLSDYLDIVEVNSTFYRIPEANTAASWLEQTRHNSRFQFIIKLWQGFTHEGRPAESIEMKKFVSLLEPFMLAGKLGTVLIQFPWSYKRSGENLIVLDKIVKALAPAPCHVEFRHASWHCDEVLYFLRERRTGWVNIDQPIIGASMQPTREVLSSQAYFRFHGRNYNDWFREGSDRNHRYNYYYSSGELQEWVPLIRESIPQAEKTMVIFNNHFKGQAFANSLQLLALLTENKPILPERIVEQYPELRAIGTISPSQGTLPLF
jgi:uncharacterized protein YecE (DUF72 family)